MNTKILYQGRASVRIITKDNKVIYIDPYAGNKYDLEADIILITHEHFDHNQLDKITNKNNAKIIHYYDCIKDNDYKVFHIDNITVESVPAGYNKFHNEKECVGYILTVDDKRIYFTGDTAYNSILEKINNIDYAFYCMDGVYTMNLEESIKLANKINAKHSISYHNDAKNDYNIEVAKKFDVSGNMIIEPGTEFIA